MTESNSIPRTRVGDLDIAQELHHFVEEQVIPGTDVTSANFWRALQDIIANLAPLNSELLAVRDRMQQQIDDWHINNRGGALDKVAYKKFLQDIGYLVSAPEKVQVTTQYVDSEISSTAGPQLVVPLDNARYALNAANARWRSLYDALYGSDIIAETEGRAKGKKYNPVRGDKVVFLARKFLDQHFPLEKGAHAQAVLYQHNGHGLQVHMGDGSSSGLLNPDQYIGYTGEAEKPGAVLLRHNGLHVDILFGEGYFIGQRDHANIYDIHLESALTTIMDCEDSVASVDYQDKILVYQNWLGLMKGTLSESVSRGDTNFERTLTQDRDYTDVQGNAITRHGRSLMLVRNVGAHLQTNAVLYKGEPIAETFLDCMVTALAAKHDMKGTNQLKNSRTGSVYIVKPKIHGPDEVALANQLFDRVEDAIGLVRHTLKIGIMDEERRTTINLKACIAKASERLVFINTGFLDRTGDDIHTNMEAGPVPPKDELKQALWLKSYERSNVQVGINCGLPGRAQIGKGMWAMPDNMAEMMATKIDHLIAGANTSWVPSPVAATLHALHYHRLDVFHRQQSMADNPDIPIDDILEIPLLAPGRTLSTAEIQHELANNAQSILGYVSRWVGQGIGCSKVPDIDDVQLMEDCATLRISSQHISNWLHHGIVDTATVRQVMAEMAVIVDRQNAHDSHYQAMAPNFDSSFSFQAALDLALQGRSQPNGYTEFILYQRRRQCKTAS